MSRTNDPDAWHASIIEESERQIEETTAALMDPHAETPIKLWTESSAARPMSRSAARALDGAEWAFTTRRVDRTRAATLINGPVRPRVGDLVLARVDRLGHHANLQTVDGRRRRLFPGDRVVVAYGNRYACEQFEAHVPETLGPCHLVAGGGLASRAISWHDRIAKGPTHITPLGLLADTTEHNLNLADFALPPAPARLPFRPRVIAVVGTAMDAGKTDTAAFLLRGLRSAGQRTGYIKVTGTGAGGDTWLLNDAGADKVLDFTDAGLPSTYLASLEVVTSVMQTLVAEMAAHHMDTVVMEVADGLYQRETAQLIQSPAFRDTVDGVVLAARDAMGASAGVAILAHQPRPVVALSGLLSASPLQRREAFDTTGIRSYNRQELAMAANAISICEAARSDALEEAG